MSSEQRPDLDTRIEPIEVQRVGIFADLSFCGEFSPSRSKPRQENLMIIRRVCLVALVAGAAVSSLPSIAFGDADSLKLRQVQPAVKGPIYRDADGWKLRGLQPAVEGLPGADGGFESRNMILKSWIPLNNFPGFSGAPQQSGADCWGYTSSTGREYALMTLGWGLGVVEVTNPADPVILGVIPGSDSLWRDVDVIGDYAYVVTDQTGVGIQVVDLSQLDTGVVTLVRNYMQGGHTTTHTIIANPASGYLYLCGGNAANGGMIPASTTSPTFPDFAGNGWRTQYVHEAQIINYTSGPYAGKEIAFLFAAGPYYGPSYTEGLFIADVTDKSNIVTLAGIDYPGMRFCHQGWVSEDRKYLYINDELDGPGGSNGAVPRMLTRIFDVSDLAQPRLVSTFTNAMTGPIDHNEYVVGGYLYQSNYTSGLRVWDLANPLKPVEMAFFDTHPDNNGSTYNGAWGNYPFFASGNILISDMQRGLFIVQMSVLEPKLVGEPVTVLSPGQPRTVMATVGTRNAAADTVSLMVSVNGGVYTAIPMAATSSAYEAQLPAFNCLDRISYYILAVTDDQREFTYPLAGAGGPINALVKTSDTVIFADDFNQDLGWTVQSLSLNSGAWERVTPLNNGGHGAVIGDADGSGMCFVTGNSFGERVSGGPTRLISPVFDLSAHPEARVTYSRWLLSIVGTTDSLFTQVSANNGTNWTTVSSVSPVTGGWERTSFRIADYITPTSQVRIRFSISNGDSSTTEAGIDDFVLTAPVCAPCYANCDGSTAQPILNIDDFTCFINEFALAGSLPHEAQISHYANCDGSVIEPVLNVDDFTCFINSFALGCP
jgi:choice-of-anchor B domain-containing protein